MAILGEIRQKMAYRNFRANLTITPQANDQMFASDRYLRISITGHAWKIWENARKILGNNVDNTN